MRDLRQRFEALDLLETPHQWAEIERRAASPEKARTPSWLHGAWVAAATGTAVLVFAGGIVAGRWLLGAGSLLDTAFGGSGLFRVPTPKDVSVLAVVVAGTAGGSVMLAAALTLLWRWRGRNGQSSNLKTRGEVMETMEKAIDQPGRTIETVTRINRWLILAVVVLLAALVALGAWLLIDNLVTSDIERLVLDANTALNAGDDDAYVALHSPDVVFRTVIDGEHNTVYQSETGLLSWVGGLWDTWHSDITGDVVVDGDFATFPNTVGWISPDGVEGGYEGVHVFRVEEGLVVEHLFMGRAVPGS